jgi:hypothetical protein
VFAVAMLDGSTVPLVRLNVSIVLLTSGFESNYNSTSEVGPECLACDALEFGPMG